MATLPLPSGRGAARVAVIRGAMATLPSAAGSAVGLAAIRGAMATLPLPSGRGAARVAAIRGAMATLPSAAGSAVGLAAESVSGESGSPRGRCLWGLEWR
jgi:hypothetical protein